MLHGQSRWVEVVEVLERLGDLAFDAQRTLAYLRERARLLDRALGDREAAAAAWTHYAEWEPLDDEAADWLIAWLDEQGDHAGLALLHARRAEAAREAAPDAADPGPLRRLQVRARLAEARTLLYRVADAEDAAVACEDGLQVAPDDPELLEIYVRALAELNRRSECRAAIDRLLPQLLDGPLKAEMTLLRGA